MFKKITLENFKGFATNQSIEIKPITLIYGANSSGKSSILQSLLLLKQTLEQSNDKSAILLSKGKYVDLGNYNEFINGHDINKNLIIKFDLPALTSRNRYISRYIVEQINSSVEIVFSQQKSLEIDKFNLYVDNILFMTLSKATEEEIKGRRYYYRFEENNERNKTNYQISYINVNHNYYKKIVDNIKKRFPNNLKQANFETNFEENSKNNKDAFENYLYIKNIIENNNIELLNKELLLYFQKYIYTFNNFLPQISLVNDLRKSAFDKMHSYIIHEKRILPTIESLFESTSFMLMNIFNDLRYIGPLRKNPERYYVFSGNPSYYVGTTGAESPDILFANDNKILKNTNKWVEKFTNYKLKPTYARKKSKTKGMQNVYSLRLLDKITNVDVNITDVGFGISQILPIIIQSCLSKSSLILIEQPEIHIHPKLQAEMGSMFAEACENNNFIIETHSENILLRLKKLVRTGKLDKDKLSIIYVDKTEEGSICCPIRLDDNGDFIDKWPKGFFEESLEELF